MKRWMIFSTAPLSALTLVALFLAFSAHTSGEQGNAGSVMAASLHRTPTPTISPSPTPPPVFSATVMVVPDKTLGIISDTITARVTMRVRQGCAYHLYNLTMRQTGEDAPIFAPETETVGPGISFPYTFTLRAVTTGTVTLNGRAYGEKAICGCMMWVYVNGFSLPVTIVDHIHRVYVPVMLYVGDPELPGD